MSARNTQQIKYNKGREGQIVTSDGVSPLTFDRTLSLSITMQIPRYNFCDMMDDNV